MGFQTPQYKLSRLIDEIDDGRIQLPDFQRSYRWDDERVRSLLVTLTLGYPLGVIMTLRTGGAHVRFQPTPVERTPERAGEATPALLLLDGQQRLTSFYQALSGDGVVHTEDGAERRYYIDVAAALDDPARRDDAIISVPKDGIVRTNFGRDVVLDLSTEDKEREHGYFPLRLVFHKAAMNWVFAYPDRDIAQRFLTELIQPLIDYSIPAIELEKDTTKGAVATVFEKVNTGGMSLTVFELLTAKFAGDGDYHRKHDKDFRLKNDWEATQHELARFPALQNFANTDLLQAVTLLVTRSKPVKTSGRQDSILALELDEYLTWAPLVREALKWVAKFLEQEKIHTAKEVPYQAQIIPLVVIRVLLGDAVDKYGPRKRLAQWYWCGVLGEIYSGASETRTARDVDEVPGWVADEVQATPTPATIATATFSESRLLTLRTRTSAAYKGIYALIMQNDCMDWREHKSFTQTQYSAINVDIHHIFPQAWCKKHEIDRAHYDSIVNKTALSATTNRIIGGVAPSKYLPKIAKQAGIEADQLDSIISKHLIDTKVLREDNFDAFFIARRHALLELVESAMGKPVQRDVVEDPPPIRIGFAHALRKARIG